MDSFSFVSVLWLSSCCADGQCMPAPCDLTGGLWLQGQQRFGGDLFLGLIVMKILGYAACQVMFFPKPDFCICSLYGGRVGTFPTPQQHSS